MKKDEFLLIVKSRLYIFDEETISQELELLDREISGYIESGSNEDDALDKVGKLNDVVSKIFAKHGVDPKKINGHGVLYNGMEEFFSIVHSLVDAMSKNGIKENTKIIIDLILLFVVVALVKIPFIAVQNLGDTLFSYFNVPAISNVWSLLIDLIYIVVAVVVFVNLFNRYFSVYKGKKKASIKGKALESISLSDDKKDA